MTSSNMVRSIAAVAAADLDLLDEVTGGGDYERLLPYTQQITFFGFPLRCVTLERLIQLKRAAGRPKDLEILAELTALLEERHKQNDDSPQIG